MAYTKSNLISRAGYSGFAGDTPGSWTGGGYTPVAAIGDWWDTITEAVGTGLKYYGGQQVAAGAAAVTAQQNKDLTAALMARQGIGMETVLLIGGVGLAAFLLLRKKS
jgi:hypothetical protein